MSYFSNQSQQSRFFAPSSASASQPQAQTQSPSQTQHRPRTTKHFSTKISTGNLRSQAEDTGGTEGMLHPLRQTWVFWFRQQRLPGNKITSYEEGIKRIGAFGSVESFLSLYTHLTPPSSIQPTTDYLLFHSSIQRPVWEDPLNITGGKWIVRLKKGVADRLWEDLVMAVVGDQFDDACASTSGTGKVNGKAVKDSWEDEDEDDEENGEGEGKYPEICGCTISVRQHEDIICLWNRTDGDVRLRERIRDMFRKVMRLPESTIMEYKSNNDSMQDRSSFRNTLATDRTPLS